MSATPIGPSVRVLLVDDDPLVRSALSLLLDGAEGIVVVGEVGDGDEVERALDAHHPHVVLMDLRMPRVDGITATTRVRRRPEPPDVVVLTTFDADELVLRALRAGASGFLLKDTPPADLVAAVRRVAAGDPILSPRVVRTLIDLVADDRRDEAADALEQLSGRERDVAVAVTRGLANADIAVELHMSVATVKAHVSRILDKLGLDNRTQVALLGHDAGLA